MTDMMVQNSISQRPSEQRSSSAKSRIPKPADYEKFQIGATPYESKGYLISTPLWKAPVSMVEDTFENIKSIGRGLSGKGNDHELGQTNDIGMKAGGLALAGYLATKRVIPTKKGMEFVGFASFFASMVLFPKLFINSPIKALYGFNVDQKCIDSQGRKNNLHRDPQYFASDLYSSEQLETIGDKMGVDKEMENRQEFVKRKMTKISTQANTMWMLTAGLATPIMGALISSGIEKGLNEAQKAEKTRQVNNKTARLGENLENADAVAQKRFDKKGFEALNTLLKSNNDKNVDDKFINKLVKLLDKSSNLKLENNLRQDLKNLLATNEISDVSEFIGPIEIKVPAKMGSTETITHVFSKESIKNALMVGKNLNDNQVINAEEIKNRLNGLFIDQTESYSNNRSLSNRLNDAFSQALEAKLNTPSLRLTEEKAAKIKKAFEAMDAFKVKNSVLADYVDHRIGEKEDSVKARQWKKTSEGIMDAMGFSHKELEQIKKAPASARGIMEAKMSELAKEGNEAKYQKAVAKIANLINNFDNVMAKGSREGKDFKSEVGDMTVKFYDELADKARSSSLNSVADYFAGNGSTLTASAKKNAIESVENSVLGAQSSLYKVVQGLDLFKRLEAEKTLDPKVVEVVKYAIMDGTYGDHFVKLNVEAPENYKKIMGTLFGPDLNQATKDALGKNENLLTNIKEHMKNLRNQLGNAHYRFKTGHKLDYDQHDPGWKIDKEGFVLDNEGNRISKALSNDEVGKRAAKFKDLGDLKKQTMVGETLSKFTQKSAEQMHNTKHWTRLFGGIGLGVAIVTLASPFFFGKIKAPQKQANKEVSNNG